jgi:hypothetical protein
MGLPQLSLYFCLSSMPMVQRHALESSMPGGEGKAPDFYYLPLPMGRTRYSLPGYCAGKRRRRNRKQYAQGEQHAMGSNMLGSSITGSYIASLHEIEDNFVFASIWGTAPHIAKKTVGSSSYYGGIIKSHFKTSLSSISSKIAIWRTLLCYSPLACCFPWAFYSPWAMCMLIPLGHAVPFWACCCPLGFLCHLWKVSS